MRYGSLFSGGLGLDMAVHMLWPDAEPAWVCENDPHAARLIAHHLPDVPNLGDITAVDWSQVEPVDLLVGGFPCQDISTAGKRAGIKEGTRSGLWFRFADAIRELRPRLVLLENVAALTSAGGGLDVVLGSLAEVGFDAEWGVLRASDVGAPHGRARWFCVACPDGVAGAPGGARSGRPGTVAEPGTVAGAVGLRRTSAPHSTLDGRPERRTETGQRAGIGDRDDEAPADPERVGGERRRGDRDVAGTPRAGEADGEQRQRDGDASGHRRPTSADADGRRLEGHPQPHGGTVGPELEASRRAAADRCDSAPAHPDVEGLEGRRPERQRPDQRPLRTRGVEAWGDYWPAIARWQHITGRPAPAPTDERTRLNPAFVEWMMGWPPGWTDLLSRTQALKALGNGVVPLQSAAAYSQLLERAALREVAA